MVHYSVQGNHVHLIVEAASSQSLSSGMRGLMVRVARRVNPVLFRRGRLWADRWHGRALASPRQVRNALVYVLQNWRKHASRSRANHGQSKGESALAAGAWQCALDSLSSAPWFDGFTVPQPRSGAGPPNALPARTWLLTTGWYRHGRIDPREVPKSL